MGSRTGPGRGTRWRPGDRVGAVPLDLSASRTRTIAVLVVVLAAGLASRRVAGLPTFVEDHAGDVLWATAVVLVLSLLRSGRRPIEYALAGFVIAAIVEASQLWHLAWLEDLRDNDLAALVLGRGFLWSDFPRYAAGCLLGGALVAVVGRLSSGARRMPS